MQVIVFFVFISKKCRSAALLLWLISGTNQEEEFVSHKVSQPFFTVNIN